MSLFRIKLILREKRKDLFPNREWKKAKDFNNNGLSTTNRKTKKKWLRGRKIRKQ